MEFNLKSILFSLKEEIKNFSLRKISDEDFEKIWEKVIDKVNNEPPPKIAFIGNCGVGKSSTLNSLFNAGQAISVTETCTQEDGLIKIKTGTVEGEKEFLDIYEIPELDESIKSHEKHLETYKKVLSSIDIDVAIWVLEANNGGLKNIRETLNDIWKFNPTLINRTVFALNKVDIIHPGQSEWNTFTNLPSNEQEFNIAERIKDVEEIIKKIVPKWNGQIVGYSTEKRYNLTKLFKIILDVVSEERKWIVASRKALSEYIELIDDKFLPEEFKGKRKELQKKQIDINVKI